MMDNKEIDRQIAEKVMGYELHEHHHTQLQFSSPVRHWQEKGIPEAEKIAMVEFTPSTRIDHAFEVVEKMQETEADPCDFFLTRHFNDKWEASFEGQTGNFFKEADTPAMAICKAALEAVKGKSDG